MSGKSVMEMVWGTLLVVCITFIAGLVLLCFWGMCSRDFLKFAFFAVIVTAIGIPLIEWCGNALAAAENARKSTHSSTNRNPEMNMYFESNAVFNNSNAKTVSVQVVPDDAILDLKKENEELKRRVRNSEFAAQEAKTELIMERRKYQSETRALREKFNRCFDDCKQYSRLLNAARAQIKTEQKACLEKLEISHLERMELHAWRKAEKARKKQDARLRARVKKIRRQTKVGSVTIAAKDYSVAARVARQCDIPTHRLEVSNAIIALAEYVKPYSPTEEFQVYLWDCRTIEALLEDISESIVRTAFGEEWEEMLIAGLIGLNIIETPPLRAILADIPAAAKPGGDGQQKRKRPA